MRFLVYFLIFASLRSAWTFENGFLKAFTGGVDVLIEESFDKVETYENVKFNYTVTCNKSMQLLLKNGGEALPKNGGLKQQKERRNRGEDGVSLPQKSTNGTVLKNDSGYFTSVVEDVPAQISVKLSINDTTIAKIEEKHTSEFIHINCTKGNEEVVQVTAGHLGITRLTLEMRDGDAVELGIRDVAIRVKRKITLFDKLSFYILAPLILLNKCAFGAKIEVDTLKHIVTQPIALFLCLTMQFLAMPFLAFAYAWIFKLDQAMSLALFVGATCPGGGGGYVISYLVGGDVTLAISASLLSTLVAMVAMPGVIGLYAWLMDVPDTIAIPYSEIIILLFVIAVPISSGMIINRKWPNFAKKFVKIIRPLSLFLIFSGFLFLAVTSKYIIHGPPIGWALAFLLPSSGFLLSITVSRCFGQSWPFTKAISLESGMKNTILGIAVIELTYPQPEADLSSILIIMVTLGHTSLAMLWYFGHLIWQRCFPAKHGKGEFMKLENIDDDDDEDSDASEAMALKS